MRYLIYVDSDNNISRRIETFDENEDGIELSQEEYQKLQDFLKFNPTTREFYEPIVTEEQKTISWQEQVENAIGALAEQVAKNTLLGGTIT